MTRREVRPLEDVLRYENDEVVQRFAADHHVSVADAEELFLETKRWLWLCATRIDGPRIPLLSEARAIDMMWHTFIIFTKDYADFCTEYFGVFVHHHPRTRVETNAWNERVAADPVAALAERKALLRGAYETICDELGSATLKKWCEDFPRRFPTL